MGLFSKLATDEIAAVAVPLQNVCNTLANGDGSTASIVGQGVVLQGVLLSLSPQLQKIGVNDFFSALSGIIATEAANAQAAMLSGIIATEADKAQAVLNTPAPPAA